MLWYLTHPLGILWLLCVITAGGGLVEWVFFDRSPWPGIGAAIVLAGVVRAVAYAKGIPAWPWEKKPEP